MGGVGACAVVVVCGCTCLYVFVCCGLCCVSCSPCLFAGLWWLVGVGCMGCVVASCVGHMVDALAPRADEGRGSLRYALGSWQPSVDPGMSEWGNLAGVMSGHPYLNS